MELLARAGLVAKGSSYALVGALAIGVALGIGGKATSQQGAMQTLAGDPVGGVLIALLAAGFAAYAAWRAVQAVTGDAWAERLVCAVRALVYAAFAFTAARILTGAGGGSQNGKARKATAAVLGWPGGTWLVGAVGLVLIGVGLWNLYSGVSGSFEDAWVGGRGEEAEKWGVRAGVVGHAARFVVFALIGAFAIDAAATYDPQKAVGLDGALQKLSHQAYGDVLLGVTAAGLIAYGAYCFVDARYRDPQASA